MRYDADVTPDPKKWLAVPEQGRTKAILRYHRRIDDDAPSPTMHALVHRLAEDQIALGEPPFVEVKVAELLDAGVGRHDAIHMIGIPLTQMVLTTLNEPGVDQATLMSAYEEGVAALGPDTLERLSNERRGLGSDPPAWLTALAALGEDVPLEVEASVLAADDAVDRLAMVVDAELASPIDEWLPYHAVELLGRLDDDRAIAPLVRVLQADADEFLTDQALASLKAKGGRSVDALLTALPETGDDGRYDVLHALAACGVRDDRIYDALVAAFDEEPEFVAGLMGDYGDPRALDLLHARMQACKRTGAPEEDHIVVELAAAIRALGGALSMSENRLLLDLLADGDLDEIDDEFEREQPAVAAPRPGRNQPCWCGSGKKYKRCHWAEDEAAR